MSACGVTKRKMRAEVADGRSPHAQAERDTPRRVAVRSIGVLASAFLLASCATETSKLPASAPLPPAAPRVTGVERAADREHQRLVASLGGSYRWPAAEARLKTIVAKLVAATDTPTEGYRVTLLNSPTVNAFALPTGNIYVTRGLLALANDDSELAGVLAHEIAHVTAKHASARAELAEKSALVSRVVSEVLNNPADSETVTNQSQRTIAGFSRGQELEADRIGIRTMARAGYDPYGSSRFLASLGRNSAGRQPQASNFLATHPSTPERISQALATARSIAAPGLGERNRAEYLAAIDGIAYGDDPADGVVRGRAFIHPRLGITFVAPEGYSIDNTAQAVLGVSRNGESAFRLDAVEAGGIDSLEDFLRSGWIEKVDPASIQPLTVNGLPAATATAASNDWRFHLAVVRVGNSIYRLVLASRDRDNASGPAFTETLNSLRRLSDSEIHAVRPLRLALVKAGPGDTPDMLAARMAIANARVERFRILNGLDPSTPLATGESYKVVVE
ncbi:putative Zn-dependent protease [Chelatococcus asaccharovorans]|uniref:Putative Zn-dependent protease n=1 Tax=Chelatococcus asaccharovorans TaxID=28210 RepID=A0A2V3U8C8_9HYPH|nr:putative Zn-dependent protease [Chelatococcus asaccharovorans]